MLDAHKQRPIALPYLTVLDNTDINIIVLILQWMLLYSVLQLDSVLWTGLHISKGELQSLLPYFMLQLKCLHHFHKQSIEHYKWMKGQDKKSLIAACWWVQSLYLWCRFVYIFVEQRAILFINPLSLRCDLRLKVFNLSDRYNAQWWTTYDLLLLRLVAILLSLVPIRPNLHGSEAAHREHQ